MHDRRMRRHSELLSDGLVLLISRGRIVRASPGAGDHLGDCIGKLPSEAFAPLFGPAARTVIAALDDLDESGAPFHLMLRDREERLHEAIGHPQGALVRLTLREASNIDGELRRLRRRLGQVEHDCELLNHQLATIQHIFAHGSMVIWTRTQDGNVNWSHGSISTADGAVAAHDVALVVSAKAQFASDDDAGDATPRRARIQIVPEGAAGPVPLDSVELPVDEEQIVGFAVDGSQAATAERSLVRFVKTMTDTFAHLNLGLAIFDRAGKLFLFNPALAGIWRADPAWLAGRPSMREIIDDLRIKRRLPEHTDFHAWRARLLDLFEESDSADFEDLWHLADGSNIRVIARPHPDGALAFVFDDVTERLGLEQSFRNSIDLRHAILDRLDEGIAVFGPDGKTQFVNQAFQRVWRFDAGEVTRESHARDVVPLCAAVTREEGVWRRLEGFITGEESRGSWGARLTVNDGRSLSARFSPLPDGSTMTVFADVTDSERIAHALRERNEALETAEAMRTELLDEISYRLRTPLNSVAGFSELLLDTRTGPLNEVQQDYTKNILMAAQQLNEAVSGVSDMVDMPDAAIEFASGQLNLEDLIERTKRLLDRRAGERDVRLRTGLEAPIADFACDDGRMSKIVFNLAHDAINRCPAGGAVVLGANRADDGAVTIWTSETSSDRALLEDPSSLPGIELLRRQVSLANGFVELDAKRDDAVFRVKCRFFPRGSRDVAGPAAASIEEAEKIAEDPEIGSKPRRGARRGASSGR